MFTLLVALGCGLGALSRYYLSRKIDRIWGDSFPLGTFVVNVVGSFLLGLCLAGSMRVLSADTGQSVLVSFFGVGYCGGLTTFSTFSLQSLKLVSEAKWRLVGLQIFGSLLVCMLCVYGGFFLAGGDW